MKIMFQNYTTKTSTEATYLAQCLSMAGVECDVWSNPNLSTYDALDTYRPDLIVTHYKFMTNDLYRYISTNRGPELVLNVTGALPEECEKIEELTDSGVKIPLIYTNSFDQKEKFKKLKLNGIYPAADIFLHKQPSKPKMPLGVLNDGNTESVAKAVQDNEKYHLLSLEKSDYSDFEANVRTLHELYHFYERFVIAGSLSLTTSQIFFDSCLACHKVDILPEEQSVEEFDKFLCSVFKEPEKEPEDLTRNLQKQILARHTPFNRAERLMRFLKNEEAVRNLQKLKNDVVKQ